MGVRAGGKRKPAGEPTPTVPVETVRGSAKSKAKPGGATGQAAPTTPAAKRKAKAEEVAAKARADIDAIANKPKPKAKAKETTKADIEAFPKNPKTPQGKGATKADLDAMLASNKKTPQGKGATKADIDEMTKPSEGKKKPAAKAKATPKVADIRHEAQANRELAYDVGDKVGGARKDTFQKNFTAEPTMQNLEALEKIAPEVAQKMCVKANILPKIDFEREHKNGVEINAAMLKQLIYDRVAPKPQGDTAEDRAAYLSGINKLHRIMAPIKTYDELRKAISELGTIASAGKRHDDAKASLDKYKADPSRYTYFNTESYQATVDRGAEAKKMLDFGALGDKLEAFFTKSDSRIRTLQTLSDKKLDWGTYFKPSEDGADEKERGATRGASRKKWERMAVSEHQRTGGKETTVKKPEDMVKQFNMKGVEFGNWVDDSSGLYHLKRASEAFSDLAEVLGVDEKDISLNGRLSMAFGARGKAGAAAHYEPDRKVINMTKHGGAGSLAHEWGHAMDNVMYAYSNNSAGSLALASDGVNAMGDHDPELKRLYGDLMDTVRKPAPGQPGATRKVEYDTKANQFGNYFPEMRRDVQGGMSMEDTVTKWSDKHQREFDASMRALDSMRSRFSAKDLDKRVLKAQRELKTKLKELPHRVAQEYKNRNGWTAEHITGHINMPTGQSEYYTRMQDFDGGGKPYYAQGCEMFARVFESMIEDKLTAKKRKNNYLVWDTKTSKGNLDAPFPVGEERKQMHAAMDALLKHIAKTKALKKAFEMELRKALFNEQELREKGAQYIAKLAALKERRDPEGIEGVFDRLWADNVVKAFDESKVSRDEAGKFASTDGDREIEDFNAMLTKHARKFGSAEEFAASVNRPGFGGKSVADLFGMIDNNSHNHLDADAIKTYLSQGGDYYYLTHVDPKTLEVENEGYLTGIHTTPFDQSTAKPIVVGNNNFIVDGRHRTVNAKQSDAPRIQAYVPAQHYYNQHVGSDVLLQKSIVPDPSGNSPFGNNDSVMYRGIGQKELDAINATGVIQSKGKGNDDDKEARETCFTNLFEQAQGYAVSQYSLYDEKAAYVIALPKPPWIEEDEHGELVSKQPVPFGVGVIVPIPNPDEERDIFHDATKVSGTSEV